jgi:hypothetical protein
MDAAAADALARLVNARGDAFALGWNAGLLPGAAPEGAPPGAGVGAVPLWLAPLVWWFSREWRHE